MTKEEALKAVETLHIVTQRAMQPAQVHVECQMLREKLSLFIDSAQTESEKKVDPAPEEK